MQIFWGGKIMHFFYSVQYFKDNLITVTRYMYIFKIGDGSCYYELYQCYINILVKGLPILYVGDLLG